MRVVKEIPGERYNITIYSWNNKLLIKVEQGAFEQTYKISEMDLLPGVDLSEVVMENSFLEKVEGRFKEMEADFNQLIGDYV
ncbi:MAG: hypothetical protein AAFQ94_29335 [Bacteroidota bacterium]